MRYCRFFMILTVAAMLIFATDASAKKTAKKDASEKPCPTGKADAKPCPTCKDDAKPCPTGKADAKPCPTGEGGEEGPCTTDATKKPKSVIDPETGQLRQEKLLWAKSFLWAKAPDLDVEKWLTEKPELKGKYVLVEHWATWCPPCRRSLNLLNEWQEKFAGEDFAIVAISDEPEADVRALDSKEIKYEDIKFPLAIDTKARMKDELGVFGIPHVVIIEPGGFVIWEGFPLQKGHELTDEIIEKILAIGKKLKTKDEAKDKPKKKAKK